MDECKNLPATPPKCNRPVLFQNCMDKCPDFTSGGPFFKKEHYEEYCRLKFCKKKDTLYDEQCENRCEYACRTYYGVKGANTGGLRHVRNCSIRGVDQHRRLENVCPDRWTK